MGHAATQSQSQHFHAAVCSWELTLIKCPRACPHLRSCQRNHVRTLILGQEIVIVVYAWVQPDLLEPWVFVRIRRRCLAHEAAFVALRRQSAAATAWSSLRSRCAPGGQVPGTEGGTIFGCFDCQSCAFRKHCWHGLGCRRNERLSLLIPTLELSTPVSGVARAQHGPPAPVHYRILTARDARQHGDASSARTTNRAADHASRIPTSCVPVRGGLSLSLSKELQPSDGCEGVPALNTRSRVAK